MLTSLPSETPALTACTAPVPSGLDALGKPLNRWLLAVASACCVLLPANLEAATSAANHAAATPSTALAVSAVPEAAAEPNQDVVSGPQALELEHGVHVQLPAGQAFMRKELAQKNLEKMGNFHNENLLGVVFDDNGKEDWFVTVRYDAEGYVKDDEAVDADELLDAIKEGTKQANEERKERGFATFEIDGWSEPPHYDKSAHHLLWALIASDNEGKSVNFNTRILGRHGILSLNLVTVPEHLAVQKPQLAALMRGTQFVSGERYEDFSSSTDAVAEYGLSGLVLAGAGLGAVKLLKLGLLAKSWNVILALLLAGKKFAILGLAALAGLAKRFFGKKDEALSEPNLSQPNLSQQTLSQQSLPEQLTAHNDDEPKP